MRPRLILTLIALVVGSLLALSNVANAQLSEVAGQLNFQVQVGHSQTIPLQLINTGTGNLSILIEPPNRLQITSAAGTGANQITPSVTISPLNFVMTPHQLYKVNVTVYMPLKNAPNLTTWQGIVSAQVAPSNSSGSGGGATVIEGVGKIFNIAAVPSTTTTTIAATTTAPALSFSNLGTQQLAMALGVIALLIIIYYGMHGKPKKAKKEKKQKQRKRKTTKRGKSKKKPRRRRR